MSKDYTAAVIRLEQSYLTMQLARKVVAAEVKSEYQAIMRDEIARRQKAAEVAFANDLAIEVAAGVPGNVIREHVLRTRDWGRWTKWRDLAGIDPDRLTLRNALAARAESESSFRWSPEGAILFVLKNSQGVALEPALEYDMSTNRFTGGVWWPDLIGGDDSPERAARKEDPELNNFVSAEIQRALDAEEITS